MMLYTQRSCYLKGYETMAKPWAGKRSRLQGDARAKYKKDVRWIGGILYFTKTLTEVPGVAHVPKAGRSVIGITAHNSYKGG